MNNIEDLEKEFYEIIGVPIGISTNTLIEELVLEQLYVERGLISPAPPPIANLLQNEEYIRGVLGINIPLNESYPYSLELQQRILEEQLLMEGWFDGFKKLGTDAKNMALALRYMFEDKSRISTFVKQAYTTVIKEPLTKITDFIKKLASKLSDLFDKFVMPKIQAVWDKVKGVLEKVLEMLENGWEKIKGMSGWKQALMVLAFGTGIGYMWKTKGWGEFIEKIGDKIDDIGKLTKKYGGMLADRLKKNKGPINLAKAVGKGAKKGAKSLKGESIYATASLEAILLEDNDAALNEFLGGIFGKKNKDAAEMGLELPKGAKAPSDGILVSPKQAKKAGIKGKSEKEAEEEKDDSGGGGGGGEEDEDDDGSLSIIGDLKDAFAETVQPLIDTLKEKFATMATTALKSMGMDAMLGMVTGGIGPFIKGIKKVYGGMSTISDLFGDTFKAFIKQIKNPEAEAEEAEKGEDDPTEAAWHDNEKLLREFIREKLLAA